MKACVTLFPGNQQISRMLATAGQSCFVELCTVERCLWWECSDCTVNTENGQWTVPCNYNKKLCRCIEGPRDAFCNSKQQKWPVGMDGWRAVVKSGSFILADQKRMSRSFSC